MEDIRRLLWSFAESFNNFDPKGVAKHFTVPYTVASDHGLACFRTEDEALTNARALIGIYKNWGYERARLVDLGLQQRSDRFCSVVASWEVQRRGNQEPWAFRTAYELIKQPDGWRIYCCTAFDEMKMKPSVPTSSAQT
jgi:ketosteroid isomerase-like protein